MKRNNNKILEKWCSVCFSFSHFNEMVEDYTIALNRACILENQDKYLRQCSSSFLKDNTPEKIMAIANDCFFENPLFKIFNYVPTSCIEESFICSNNYDCIEKFIYKISSNKQSLGVHIENITYQYIRNVMFDSVLKKITDFLSDSKNSAILNYKVTEGQCKSCGCSLELNVNVCKYCGSSVDFLQGYVKEGEFFEKSLLNSIYNIDVNQDTTKSNTDIKNFICGKTFYTLISELPDFKETQNKIRGDNLQFTGIYKDKYNIFTYNKLQPNKCITINDNIVETVEKENILINPSLIFSCLLPIHFNNIDSNISILLNSSIIEGDNNFNLLVI